MASSYNLIEQISIEPIVARYIRHANFDFDSSLKGKSKTRCALRKDESRIEAIFELLATSPYLEEAGLDCRQYHNKIQDEVDNARYSQRTAEFVLTLLPNLKTLQLPKYWRPTCETDKLVGTVIERARQKNMSRWDSPSLAQVKKFSSSSFSEDIRRYDLDSEQKGFTLDWAIPFLSLPQVQSFCGPASVQGSKSPMNRYPHSGPGMALEDIKLHSASVGPISIARFLKHAPNLKTLRYSHRSSSYDSFRDWDICQFITAIAEVAGSHLIELSISIDKWSRGQIAPGKPSMQCFQQLQNLEIPIELASCVLDFRVRSPASLFGTLVPASKSQLSLNSQGPNSGDMAIDVMFYNFSEEKASKASNLKEIYLPGWLASLAPEIEKAGVTLHMTP